MEGAVHASAKFTEKKNHGDKGIQCLLSFIEQNAFIELQKAFSIVIMDTAITSWNEQISDACEKASNVTLILSITGCKLSCYQMVRKILLIKMCRKFWHQRGGIHLTRIA